MKKIKFILMSLLLIALSSCNINSSSSSSAITSNSTSISTNSSSQEKIWGSVPDNVKVYTELEAIEHMQSPSYVQFEDMYVSGIIASSKYGFYLILIILVVLLFFLLSLSETFCQILLIASHPHCNILDHYIFLL